MIAMSSVLAAPPATWTFRVQQNLLNQPVAVAELTGGQTPGSYIRVSCSALDGPRTVIGLGYRAFGATGPSAEAPQRERLRLSATSDLDIEASRDLKEPLIETYVATGGDALRAARLVADATAVNVTAGTTSTLFVYAGAANPIQSVRDACPFKD